MHQVLCQLEDILLQTKDDSTKRKICFLGEQLQQVLVTRSTGHRFSDRTMEFCVKFWKISKLLYKEIVYQDLLCLPTPSHVAK